MDVRHQPESTSSSTIHEKSVREADGFDIKQRRFFRNVLLKGVLFFLLANLIFAWLYPMAALGRFSAYNHFFPGRVRLPYADNPERAYSLTLNNIEAMIASHQLSGQRKPSDEFRILLIGDSATWGYLLTPDETLSAFLNQDLRTHQTHRNIHFYNLGYPVMSLTKDLLLLFHSLRFEPDLVVWLVTLESFPLDKQLFPPILRNNYQLLQEINETYVLKLDLTGQKIRPKNFWQRSLVGSRRDLADILRLQLYGPLWAATKIDQEIPETYTLRQEDLSADLSFHSFQPPGLDESDLAFHLLEAGIRMASPIPLLIINEPIFISHGLNSDLRYNYYYPRWAYDRYRTIMKEKSLENAWRYRDFWDVIPAAEFTNTAVHLSPAGSQQLANRVIQAVLEEIKFLSSP